MAGNEAKRRPPWAFLLGGVLLAAVLGALGYLYFRDVNRLMSPEPAPDRSVREIVRELRGAE